MPRNSTYSTRREEDLDLDLTDKSNVETLVELSPFVFLIIPFILTMLRIYRRLERVEFLKSTVQKLMYGCLVLCAAA